jgi:hypothetical protein
LGKKPGIPLPPKPGEDRTRFDSAVKESLEVIMGRRGFTIAALPSAASNTQIIDKINEIIATIQS